MAQRDNAGNQAQGEGAVNSGCGHSGQAEISHWPQDGSKDQAWESLAPADSAQCWERNQSPGDGALAQWEQGVPPWTPCPRHAACPPLPGPQVFLGPCVTTHPPRCALYCERKRHICRREAVLKGPVAPFPGKSEEEHGSSHSFDGTHVCFPKLTSSLPSAACPALPLLFSSQGCDPGPRNCRCVPQVAGNTSRTNTEADYLCLLTWSAALTSVHWTLRGLFT